MISLRPSGTQLVSRKGAMTFLIAMMFAAQAMAELPLDGKDGRNVAIDQFQPESGKLSGIGER